MLPDSSYKKDSVRITTLHKGHCNPTEKNHSEVICPATICSTLECITLVVNPYAPKYLMSCLLFLPLRSLPGLTLSEYSPEGA
jgi:hypothetical protein